MSVTAAWNGRISIRVRMCVLWSGALAALALLGLTAAGLRAEPTDSDALFPIMVNDKVGYIDRTGKVVIAPQFDRVDYFHEGRAAVMVGGDKKGKQGKWGYIDTTGAYILEPRLTETKDKHYVAKPFSHGLAAVLVNGKYGFIDRAGKMVIEPRFEDTTWFSEGLAAVKLKGRWEHPLEARWGYIDTTGKMVIPARFCEAGDFWEGLAPAAEPPAKGGAPRLGYIDKTGKFAIQPRFIFAHGFSSGRAFVRTTMSRARQPRQGAWIDRTGKVVIGPWQIERLRPPFAYIETDFSEGLLPRLVGSKIGYADITGKLVIRPRFDHVEPFSEGLAAVRLGDKWGFIDTTGEFIIEPTFRGEGDFCPFDDFFHGLALVQTHDLYGYIDRTGRFVWRGKPD